MKISILLLAFSAAAAPAHASSAALWQCDGQELEGLAVSAGHDGQFEAGVSWDCWPGGGICVRDVQADRLVSTDGKTVFEAPHYRLVIRTDLPAARDGGFEGHISATGQGPSDQGGGFTLDEAVTCSRK